MADPARSPDTGAETGVGPDPGAPPGIPRWLQVSGLIVVLLIVLVVGISFIAGMEHGPGQFGPGQHGPGGDAGGDPEGNAPPIDGAPELAVTADELAFYPDRIEVTAGEPVNVALTAADILHDLVVDEVDFHLAADRDETVIGGLLLDEPGTYVGFCSVEGHREAGMELEIFVTPSDG